MTQTYTQRRLIAASAFGALTAIIMFAQAGPASAATSVLNCEGTSRRAVMECCQHQVKKHGLPMWMRQSGAACNSRIVTCSRSVHSASANKPCRISKIYNDGGKDGKGGKDKGGRDNGGRGNKP